MVVDPRDADFYLYSHAAIVGTSRPCHDHVLLNEGQFTMAEIETMGFGLAHLYQRCPKSVSIPAPQYYAHHAASHAKFYLDRSGDSMSVASGASGGSGDRTPEVFVGPVVHDNLRHKLYFC